jgi:hypothetical protein
MPAVAPSAPITQSASQFKVMRFTGAWEDMADFEDFQADLLRRRRNRAHKAATEHCSAAFADRLRRNHRGQP